MGPGYGASPGMKSAGPGPGYGYGAGGGGRFGRFGRFGNGRGGAFNNGPGVEKYPYGNGAGPAMPEVSTQMLSSLFFFLRLLIKISVIQPAYGR